MRNRLTMTAPHALAVLLALGSTHALSAGASCQAESTTTRNTLVELFTSDGCSSCPPANHWISSVLAEGQSSIIPVSLHVTYWNHLGWRDAFSAPFFDQRQDWYVQWASNHFPYTPELIRNGREWSGWRTRGSEHGDERQRAAVTLTLDLSHHTESALDAQVMIHEVPAGTLPRPTDSQLVVYLYEDGVSEHPDAGELRGELLKHDHVVRDWQTIDRPRIGQPNALHFLLPPQANAARTGLVAFLQDRSSGEVLQAVDLPNCR